MTRFSISDVKVDVHLNVLVFEFDVLLRRFNRLSEIEKFPTLLAASMDRLSLRHNIYNCNVAASVS